MKNYKLSLIIPAYNEEENVKKMYSRIKEVFNDGVQYIFIDDGSKDNTLNIIKELAKQDNDVLGLSFSRNFGKEAAMYCGLKYTKGEYISFMDCDLQQDPSYVKEMVEILDNDPNLDCVSAVQKARKENFLISFIKNSFYNIINSLSDLEIVNGASDFRTFRTNVKEALLSLTETNRFTKGLFPWVGFHTKYIEYEVKERQSGQSKYSFRFLLNYAFKGITSYSTKLLKLPLYLGIISILVSLIYLLFNINTLETNKLIIFLLLLLFGLLFIVLSIISTYLSNIYDQTKNRPIYIVREEFGNDK